MKTERNVTVGLHPQKTARFVRDMRTNYPLYLIALPGIIFYIVFAYFPLYGILIAFKEYSPIAGVWGSPWIGLEKFREFFGSMYFGRTVKNTIMLNVYLLLFSFPMPIIMALLLNEVRQRKFKRVVQTVTYMPHFISLVVICGMIIDFTSNDGLITRAFQAMGFEYTNLLQESGLFKGIYVISDIWQSVGWGSIIYLAALSGIDTQLYEAAAIDGAGKFKQLLHVTLPGIIPTIIIMLILRLGSIMSLGADKIILLYTPVVYESADTISSYVYRKGLIETDQSYATAVGLFNSLINFVLVFSANYFSKKISNNSLW